MTRLPRIGILLATIAAFLFSAGQLTHGQTPSRIPWETSRVKGSPVPPPPFTTSRAFPSLRFSEPIEMVPIPGSNRLMLAEHGGKIFTFPNRDDVSTPDLFIDMKKVNPGIQEVYSIAFHPGFATNRYVYIWYILKPELPDGTHIARFTMTQSDPPGLDVASEKTIFTWKSGGHNGGSICFGNDGMLYISTGDGAGPSPPDILNTGQDITDLLGSILRIDVDHDDEEKGYRVPKDNPFINIPGARPEIWAYGLRNPWRMSVDPVTGDIWTADVGWELWEMVHKIERGANYGWSILEGSKQPVKPGNKQGPTPFTLPIIERPHSESSSITGGYVYRGKKYPELVGSYIYGDFDTGKIWELRYENKKVTRSRELASTGHKIVSFGLNQEGELIIIDFRGTLHTLVPHNSVEQNSSFPTRLSETGLFASLNPLVPEKGVLPFAIKAEMWADYATAQRHVAIPGTGTITPGDNKWNYPSNSVLARTYSMEMERGNSNSLRKIETQLLHFDGERWNPYTFKWNAEQTDAALVDVAGDELHLTVKDAKAAGGLREQMWRFNSRTECLRCHNSWLNTVLSFNRQQLDRDLSIAGKFVGLSKDNVEKNQLELFKDLKVIDKALLRGNAPAPLVNPYGKRDADPAALDKLARSYLHINCSHCHRENAGGSTTAFMNVEMPMERAGLIDKDPAQGNFGVEGARIVAPGDPFHSIVYLRMAKGGAGHMPQLGSRLVDDEGLELIYQWISQYQPSKASPKTESNLPVKLGAFQKDPNTSIEAKTPVEALALARMMARETDPATAAKIAGTIYQTNQDTVVRDILERFIPASQRREVLGTQINTNALLALKGDFEKGRALFRNESLGLCINCHRSEGVGREFGPDLTQIGKKYSRPQILEHILEPSKLVEPSYKGVSLELKDETSVSGLLIRSTELEYTLKDSSGKEQYIPRKQVQKTTPMQISIMPEGLLQSLTAQEAADLLEYLSSKK